MCKLLKKSYMLSYNYRPAMLCVLFLGGTKLNVPSEIKPPLSKVKAINSDKQSNDVTTQMMMSGDPPFKNHSQILIWTDREERDIFRFFCITFSAWTQFQGQLLSLNLQFLRPSPYVFSRNGNFFLKVSKFSSPKKYT